MIKSLFSGITALQTNTAALGVIGDNIANVGTTAFKSCRTDFENLLSQSVGGFTGQEIGSGVKVSGLTRDWTQGTIMTTGNATDLAITGTGFFAVAEVAEGEEENEVEPASRLYTRAGAFHFNSDGLLVDHNGYCVLDSTGKPVKDPFAGTDTPTTSISIDSDGTITFENGEDDPNTDIKIGIATPKCEMIAMDQNLYKASDNTEDGIAFGEVGDGTGSISSYSLEMSNVDLASEFGKMITTQRSFQAAAKVITASDEVLQQLLSIKR